MQTNQTEIRLTHIGGPTLLIEIGAVRLLTDPAFDPAGSFYDGPLPLTKTADPAIAADRIGEINAVLLSHDEHRDNLDVSGRALLGQAGAVFTTASASRRLGGGAAGLNAWESKRLESKRVELQITGVPARHGPEGIEAVAGDVTGFLLRTAATAEGARTMYVSGDTVLFPGLDGLQDYLPIDVAVLHFGAVREHAISEHNLTLTAEEAVELVKKFDFPVVVPIHYEGWKHFREGRREIDDAFSKNGLSSRLLWLEPGVPRDI